MAKVLAVSDHAVSNPAGRFLIVTDWPEGHFGEKQASIDDPSAIVEEIRRSLL